MTQGKQLLLGVLGVGFCLTCPASAAERNPQIQRAINGGIAFLRQQQAQDGMWVYSNSPTAPSTVGASALAAWALLECNVKSDDPAVRKAADFLRRQVPTLGHTYSLSACIWFFDRLGDKADESLIEQMTLRLLAGQTATGGWSYDCPIIGPEEERRLINVLRQRPAAGPARAIQPAPAPAGNALPQGLAARSDNSNTQFASLALWVARRHGLFVDDALGRIDQRFRQSQLANGAWPYWEGTLVSSSTAMTCAGLIGLAAAHGAAAEAAKARAGPGQVPHDAKGLDPNKDPNMLAGLRYIGAWLQEFSQGRVTGGAQDRSLYFLWSLERVGEIYGLKTIGQVDWYAWGASLLLNSQQADGGWTSGIGLYSRGVDTSFALLFLARANVAKDLSVTLKGKVRDPGTRTLKAGGVGADALKNKGEKVDDASDKLAAKPDTPQLADPKVISPKKTNPGNEERTSSSPGSLDQSAQKMSDELAVAPDALQAELLAKYKEGKGPAYTLALAGAIPRLKGENKSKARDALAERFTRMTPGTLRAELKDDDPEIRRAASLACAMKDDKSHIPDLIGLLDDPEPLVGRAAHAALKSLASQDFGPAKDAPPNERAQAIAAWKGWWARQEEK
jgi:hypothetical protein